MYWLDRLISRLRGEAQVSFRCNICGRHTTIATAKLGREIPSCVCGSTVRLRSIIHLLSMELFGVSKALPDFPLKFDATGLELSGAQIYAQKLPTKINYTNTFFHKNPYLDITNVEDSRAASCDFVISSDVFEHIASPVSRAFENTMKLLKPGGLLILTVPYTKDGLTIEHFPQLHNYEIKLLNNKKVLINIAPDGSTTQFDNLVFHGGEGETLEMRVFSQSGVIASLEAAGFVEIEIHSDPVTFFGIQWSESWSLPITARKPRG